MCEIANGKINRVFKSFDCVCMYIRMVKTFSVFIQLMYTLPSNSIFLTMLPALNRRKTSFLWNFFTECDENFAKCNLCQAKLSYKTSTSNLRKHMEIRHPSESLVPGNNVSCSKADKEDVQSTTVQHTPVKSSLRISRKVAAASVNEQPDTNHQPGSSSSSDMPAAPEQTDHAQTTEQRRKVPINRKTDFLRKAVEHLDEAKKRKTKDEADIFAECWAVLFRKLENGQKIFAKRAIEEVLLQGQLGNLTMDFVQRQVVANQAEDDIMTEPSNYNLHPMHEDPIELKRSSTPSSTASGHSSSDKHLNRRNSSTRTSSSSFALDPTPPPSTVAVPSPHSQVCQGPPAKMFKSSHPSPYTNPYSTTHQNTPPHQSQRSHQDRDGHICSSCPCIAAQETEYDKIGKAWASELQKMNPEQQIYAKRAIAEIIFEGQLGALHRESVTINHINQRIPDEHETSAYIIEKTEPDFDC